MPPVHNRERLHREMSKLQTRMYRIACLNISEHLAQQDDVSQTCEDMAKVVQQTQRCLDYIHQHDFHYFSDHALFGVSSTAMTRFQEYCASSNYVEHNQLSRAFERLNSTLGSFATYATRIQEITRFSNDLLRLNSSSALDAAAYIAIFGASLSVFSFVREGPRRQTMSHIFFLHAQLASERFAQLSAQEGLTADPAFDFFREALTDFCAWRGRCRYETEVADCVQEIQATLARPFPSVSTISHVLLHTRHALTNICRLTDPDDSHINLCRLALDLLRHLRDQMPVRSRRDIDPREINELIDCLTLFRAQIVDSGSLEDDAEPHFQAILRHDTTYLTRVPVDDPSDEDHDHQANLRRCQLRLALLADWLEDQGHGQLYARFVLHANALVDSEDQPPGGISFGSDLDRIL